MPPGLCWQMYNSKLKQRHSESWCYLYFIITIISTQKNCFFFQQTEYCSTPYSIWNLIRRCCFLFPIHQLFLSNKKKSASTLCIANTKANHKWIKNDVSIRSGGIPPTSHTDRQTGRRTYKQNTWHKPWQHPFFQLMVSTCYSTWIDSNHLSCELPPFPHGWESSSNSRSPANVDRQIRHPNSSRTRTARLMKTPHMYFLLKWNFKPKKWPHKNSHFILIFNDELVTRNSTYSLFTRECNHLLFEWSGSASQVPHCNNE